MGAHVCIIDVNDKEHVVKKSDIRRVHDVNGTIVVFSGSTKNTPIRVKETPKQFFEIYLAH